MDMQKATETYNRKVTGGKSPTGMVMKILVSGILASWVFFRGVYLHMSHRWTDMMGNEHGHGARPETGDLYMLIGAGLFVVTGIFAKRWLTVAGRLIKLGGREDESHQRGTYLHDARIVAKVMDRSPGDLDIAGVPLPRDVEQQHILVAGAPGSGKSVALKAIIKTIRNRGTDGAVIHDPTGEFVSLFYNPARDLIIDPLDARHAPWSLWTDLMPGEEASLAKAIIPSNEGDNKYFSDAAQATLEVLFQQCHDIDSLVMAGLGEDTQTLIERITNAGLGGMVGSAKTFASVRGNMGPYLRSLALLPNVRRGEGVSLKDFCEKPAGRFIFLLSNGRTRDAIAPIHQLMLNQIVSVATSLRPDPSRRVWLILDELPTLLPSPALATALSQGRKFGLSAVMALQAIGQMYSRVGQHESAALLSMPKTRLILRVGDGDTAESMSAEIGERHIKRKQVSTTSNSGGQGGSSGTSTTWQDTTERAVLASEIMSLSDLSGYLRVESTTMKVQLHWTPYPVVADDYQPVPPRALPVAPPKAQED